MVIKHCFPVALSLDKNLNEDFILSRIREIKDYRLKLCKRLEAGEISVSRFTFMESSCNKQLLYFADKRLWDYVEVEFG